ncbi:MAG TPA: hypothetical protein PKM97_08530 [Bacteroidia bacterium]|nr:hypothetical protein [Bacteroidia bacterium]
MKPECFIFGILLLFITACRTEPDIPSNPKVLFQTEVQPILTGSCGQTECHAKNGTEFSLIGYEDVIENGGVVKGDARSSTLYRVISNRSSNEMPPEPMELLDDHSIKLIYVWIEQGAKNN